ncbi:MAG: hypothetical protein V3W45_05515 [Sedimentisphaerales bacterium]
MNGNNDKQKNLVDTTDCLEAVGVFRAWKNGLFIIVIICLLLLQVSFWLVNLGYVKPKESRCESSSVASADTEQISETAMQEAEEKGKIDEAAKEVSAGSEKVAEAPQQPQKQRVCPWVFFITFKRLAGLIRFFNFVFIVAAILYCLTMLFGLKVSLLGRLGGINHICRAFFLSLLVLVLLLPWQRFFAGIVFGAIYTPSELSTRCAVEIRSTFSTIFHYYRFAGHWLLVLLFLVFSQLRSSRWAKAILRRLEVI